VEIPPYWWRRCEYLGRRHILDDEEYVFVRLSLATETPGQSDASIATDRPYALQMRHCHGFAGVTKRFVAEEIKDTSAGEALVGIARRNKTHLSLYSTVAIQATDKAHLGFLRVDLWRSPARLRQGSGS
jgi:hypothetical protein